MFYHLLSVTGYVKNHSIIAGIWTGINSLNNRFIFAALDSSEKVCKFCAYCRILCRRRGFFSLLLIMATFYDWHYFLTNRSVLNYKYYYWIYTSVYHQTSTISSMLSMWFLFWIQDPTQSPQYWDKVSISSNFTWNHFLDFYYKKLMSHMKY